MLETKTLLQNRYLIERQIGSGGMGAVYLAVDERFGSHVAIKETFYKDKELGSAFEREAHLLNSLHHPALPHVSDYFTEEGGHFLVMQFIDGEDLFEILKREGVFPLSDVMRWTDSLLDALDYLHSQEPPIIHRDIKPQNLKITPRGDIILLDFGLAKLNSDNDSGMKSVFGYSRKYSPLEQIQGTGTDARSDLFALAATVYHLLTGTPPLDALTRASAIVDGDPDPLRPVNELNDEIPIETANVLTTALALNASKRFVSAKAMRQALGYTQNFGGNGDVKIIGEPSVSISQIEVSAPLTPETESFPALESFAAETANGLTAPATFESPRVREILPAAQETVLSVNDGESAKLPTPIRVNEDVHASEQKFSGVPSRAVIKTGVSGKRNSFYGAAIFGALICVSLAAWYFTRAANSAVEPNQPAIVQTEPEPVVSPETVAEANVSTEPPADKLPSAKEKKDPENKPPKLETVAEKTEVVKEIPNPVETIRETKPLPAKPAVKKTANQNNVKSAPVAATQRRENSAPESIQNEVPDIESIFSGRSSQERATRRQRQENRRAREGMTPDELREFRRIRREERRRRQNQQSIPPF